MPLPRFLRSLLGTLIALGVTASSQAGIVRFDFNVGSVIVRTYEGASPNSVQNFLNYVNTDRYDGTFIHRSPRNFVVQGGGFALNGSIFDAAGIVTDTPIADEFAISNRRGTLAFAKNSLGATSQWFFNVGNNTGLDSQDFTVFGRVLGGGMNLIDAINQAGLANFSQAENVPGEDFDEIPVIDLSVVNLKNDINASDAILLLDVAVLDLPAGDYNGDATVDARDYTIWRDTRGSTTFAEADGNGDGIVNDADLTVWQSTYGETAPSLSLGVPEPAGCLMALAGLSGLVRRRGRA